MKDSIRLHPKYGLNATIAVCFFCGKEKNEIALLGADYHDEAPMSMVIDSEPCDECKEKYVDYTLLIEAQRKRDIAAHSKKQGAPQPTGRWIAIKKEYLNIEKPSHIVFIEQDTMEQLLSKIEQDEMELACNI